MKRKEFRAIAERLLPDLPPGFAVKGDLLFIQPIEHSLRAIQFDGSSFDKTTFYVHVFVQPLCVPSEHVYFNLGRRIGGGAQSWDATSPTLFRDLSAAIRREALPFLMPIRTIEDTATAGISLHHFGDPRSEEAIGYALARSGQVRQACLTLDHFISMLSGDVEWEREVIARAKRLTRLLLENPAEAQGQLQTWEDETIIKIGLKKYR